MLIIKDVLNREVYESQIRSSRNKEWLKMENDGKGSTELCNNEVIKKDDY